MNENSTVDTNAAPDNVVTLTDLQNILVVLDLASSRGAFRGAELQPVGQLYDKISKFLQSVAPPAPAEGPEVANTEVTSETVAV
jgi:hypothetical protein